MSTLTSSHPTMSKVSAGRIALLIVLAIESVFFITVLVAYAALRDQVSWNVPHTLARLTIPLINSSILLASALIAWWSNNAIRRDNQSALKNGLLIALILGLIFVAGQIYEFKHAGLSIDDQAFGGVFFTLLGFHAAHVLAGVVFLALNLMRASMGDFSAEQHEAIDLGNWFWYYVTAVWAVLFTALYLI
jgi:heme/copper-type cytochrome/quinol oxidase subunit 3